MPLPQKWFKETLSSDQHWNAHQCERNYPPATGLHKNKHNKKTQATPSTLKYNKAKNSLII